ncbi:2-hydroxychromene-2-carboxylate isomerase [Nostoc favosum]|uniref:2-hydroxychromene-2-carboxylate isomerase n=1 Tax=Nostoc favosum CHAB5714 TaxID=2780399 RepID=A0ABS8IHH6_9NOSO|nr:DsbA family protein [Nostoc favosum]MCC5603255.1 DsbA family protein [Nostoc favosum CHAB5714]
MKTSSPRFYFCFRSPYSWVGARLLEECFDSKQYGIEYIPFWEPDKQTLILLKAKGGEFLYTPMSRHRHLYILQDIKRLTTKLGYKITWPVDRNPWWDLPHLAYLAARRYGKGSSFFWAVYQARWEKGENICSIDTISRIAQEVGLDPELIAQAPHDPTIRQEGVEALYKAYRDSVFGIPFFINGNEKFWGSDRFEDFAFNLANSEQRKIQEFRSKKTINS